MKYFLALFLFLSASQALGLTFEEKIPFGAWDYCQRNADELCGPLQPGTIITLTAERKRELFTIDNSVNHAVAYVADSVQWGVPDRWDNPINNRGDCEDRAIAKMKLLENAGWPLAAMDMLIVLNTDHTYHAVLILHTSEGELISDALMENITPLATYPLKPVKMSAGSFLHWRAPNFDHTIARN